MMATEWLIKDKRIPKRDISQQDFAEELNEIPPEYLGPGPALFGRKPSRKHWTS